MSCLYEVQPNTSDVKNSYFDNNNNSKKKKMCN